MLPPEYRQYLEQNLSVVERLSSALSGMDERLDYANMLLSRILERLGGAPPVSEEGPEWAVTLIRAINNLTSSLGGRVQLSNPETMSSHEKNVAVAGTAEQLPSVTVPYDMEAIIKAKITNSSDVYIGKTRADAQDHSVGYPLAPGEFISYRIKNLNVLYVDVLVNGEGIVWTVEQLGG